MDFTAYSMSQQKIIQALNPCDYFTLAMDDEIRREAMPGGLCGFAVQLSQTPDVSALAERISEFTARFPLVLASLQQHKNRFYWCERDTAPQNFFQHVCPEAENEQHFQHATIETLLNEQQSRAEVLPLSFHLISGQQNSVLLLRWLHPLTDAVGIDLIFKYLCTDDSAKRALFDVPKTEPLIYLQLKKYSLWQKMKLFVKAYRHISAIDLQRSIIHAKPVKPEKLRFATFQLSEAETETVAKLARHYCGLTGTSLYYIGCLMRALYRLEPEKTGDAYCIPFAFNLRKQKALTPLLSNHVGAIFPQAKRNLLQDRSTLFTHLKQQNAQVIREQLDYAFLPVMWAASWLSLEKHGENLRHSYTHHSERSSALFSNVHLSDLSQQKLLGCDISGFFHLCQLTSPPGLALLSCHYRNHLTLSYNYVEPLFDKAWIEQLHRLMLRELLEA
jgi:hypothetical protein